MSPYYETPTIPEGVTAAQWRYRNHPTNRGAMTTAGLLERHAEARRYIDSIRNGDKARYAERYYRDVIRNGLPEPSTAPLSFMAAQAVRLRLRSICRGDH